MYEKSKLAYFVRKQRETNFFSTQTRSEILFDLESTFHVELWNWVSFHLDNFLTFWKKTIYEKSKFAYFVRKQRENELFFYAS